MLTVLPCTGHDHSAMRIRKGAKNSGKGRGRTIIALLDSACSGVGYYRASDMLLPACFRTDAPARSSHGPYEGEENTTTTNGSSSGCGQHNNVRYAWPRRTFDTAGQS